MTDSVRFIPTGIAELDLALGGGLVAGRIIEVKPRTPFAAAEARPQDVAACTALHARLATVLMARSSQWCVDEVLSGLIRGHVALRPGADPVTPRELSAGFSRFCPVASRMGHTLLVRGDGTYAKSNALRFFASVRISVAAHDEGGIVIKTLKHKYFTPLKTARFALGLS